MDDLHQRYVLSVDDLWVYPQQDMFNDLGWVMYLESWPESGISEPGVVWMLSGLALHSADSAYSVCLLGEILEPQCAPKYYLSPRACRGILRRAERRGRELPPQLRQALDIMADQAHEETDQTTS